MTNNYLETVKQENMKTRISKLAAALFFAIVIAGNVNATEHKVIASSHENTQETSMNLENWMMDESIWSTTDVEYTAAQEATLNVENWMTNSYVWDVQSSNLNVENWMIDENIWLVNNWVAYSETEQDLSIESWMVNENIWKM